MNDLAQILALFSVIYSLAFDYKLIAIFQFGLFVLMVGIGELEVRE